jgi:hypothetical protein
MQIILLHKNDLRRFAEFLILLLQIPGCAIEIKKCEWNIEKLDSTVCLFVVHGDDPVLLPRTLVKAFARFISSVTAAHAAKKKCPAIEVTSLNVTSSHKNLIKYP